jgi:hypothetical protein
MHTSDTGFSITESVFERGEMHRVCQALATADLLRTKAGVRNTLCVPVVRELAGHPDLVALAATFIGEPPIPFRATLFDKSAVNNWLVAWHQDTALPVRHESRRRRGGPGR